ncbi:MAG: signal peptidase I [Candidatus Roizmanbacteria bacterium]|nr:signal peptidase I [Candidatus Roizmanbacteria bacterium]
MTRLRKSYSAVAVVFDTLTWVILVIALGMAGITVLVNRSVFGGYRSFVVQSGSMEPSIMTGDIIVIHPQERYQKRDVITFTGEGNRVVTHRIQTIIEENNSISYVTKGDANRIEDEGVPTQKDVFGKVVLVVPKLGYFVHFAQSPAGFMALIIAPTILLVLDKLIQFMHG